MVSGKLVGENPNAFSFSDVFWYFLVIFLQYEQCRHFCPLCQSWFHSTFPWVDFMKQNSASVLWTLWLIVRSGQALLRKFLLCLIPGTERHFLIPSVLTHDFQFDYDNSNNRKIITQTLGYVCSSECRVFYSVSCLFPCVSFVISWCLFSAQYDILLSITMVNMFSKSPICKYVIYLCVCVCTCVIIFMEQQKMLDSFELELQVVRASLCGQRELNSHPWQERQGLRTSEHPFSLRIPSILTEATSPHLLCDLG